MKMVMQKIKHSCVSYTKYFLFDDDDKFNVDDDYAVRSI